MGNYIDYYLQLLNSQQYLNFNYSICNMIGKGFTSEVFRGTSKSNGLPLAIKIINKNFLKEEDQKLIKSEISSLKKLKGKSPFTLNLIEVN